MYAYVDDMYGWERDHGRLPPPHSAREWIIEKRRMRARGITQARED